MAGGSIAKWLACLLPDPAAPVSIPSIQGEMINVAEVNQRLWLEESGQRLENVDRTHLELASGRRVL